MIGFAVVLLPLLILLSSIHIWLLRYAAAEGLAQEVARLVATSGTWDSGVEAASVAEAAVEYRLASELVECPPTSGCVSLSIDGSLEGGANVRAVVDVWMPGIVVPLLSRSSGFWVQVDHVETVDLFRNST